MSQTGRKAPFDVNVELRSDGKAPSDAEERLNHCVELVASLVIDELFPLLRELSDGVDEDEPMRDYPCLVPIVSGCWRPLVVVHVRLAHDHTNEAAAERLKSFVLRVHYVARKALAPPRAESWSVPGSRHPKQKVGFMPSHFWYGATA